MKPNTYSEEDSLVLARMFIGAIPGKPHLHGFYAYEMALALRGLETDTQVPNWVEFFVYNVPFKDIPLYIREPELETLIKWRLQIGK